MATIDLIYAHPYPHRSRANRALLDAVRDLPRGRACARSTTCTPTSTIDVEAEQAALPRAEIVVWQHPMYWYSVPALLKHWFDKVLAYGWAYGEGGNALRRQALPVGRRPPAATSTAYSPQGMHGHPFASFVPPIEQTARFCGMHWQTPLVLHGARRDRATKICDASQRDCRARLSELSRGQRRGGAAWLSTAMMFDVIDLPGRRRWCCVPLAKRLRLRLGARLPGRRLRDRAVRTCASSRDVESILHFSEFGVVLMLFVIGLELDPKRLWAHAPRCLSAAARCSSAGVRRADRGRVAGARPAVAGALVAGLALALSSTAIAVQTMTERNLMPTPLGRTSFAILLFQDIAAIPLIGLVPLLAATAGKPHAGGRRLGGPVKILAAIVVVVCHRPLSHAAGVAHRGRAPICARCSRRSRCCWWSASRS